jgi:hypothetical protein
MTEDAPRGRCSKCSRTMRLTSAGTLWKHKPYTRVSSAEMVSWCEGSGARPVRRKGRST